MERRIAGLLERLGHRGVGQLDGKIRVASLGLRSGAVVTMACQGPLDRLGGHALRVHLETLAQRVAIEVVAQHDAAQVRMAEEHDPEQVVYLALERNGAGPQSRDRRDVQVAFRQVDGEHRMGVICSAGDLVDHLDAHGTGWSVGVGFGGTLGRKLGGGEEGQVREAAVLQLLEHAAQVARSRPCDRDRTRAECPDVGDPGEAAEDLCGGDAGSRSDHVAAFCARCSAAKTSAADGVPAAMPSMSVSSPCISASGRGGQPGMWMSTGMIWSTPWTTL